METIKIAFSHPYAQVPVRKNPTDAGIDIFPLEHYEKDLLPGQVLIVPTGLHVLVPRGYMVRVAEKSSKSYKILGGVVDYGYPDQIYVKIVNPTPTNLFIGWRSAIAQLLVQKIETPRLVHIGIEDFREEVFGRSTDGGVDAQFKAGEQTRFWD